MTLKSTAQELFVIDPMSPASQLPADVHDLHSRHDSEGHHEMFDDLEVSEPVDVEFVVDELPGAPAGTKDPEPVLEVIDSSHVEEKEDTGSDKKGNGKNDKWNWSAHGPHGFVAWIKSRLEDVPQHSGFDSAGLERAMAYFDRLDNEISKAMRMDVDGELDANKVESVRSQLDEGLARLQARLDKVKESKKSSRKRKKSAEYEVDDDGFVKEAQKITGVQGVYVTVPLLISRVARVCINGTVSAGHDIEDLYKRQVDRYKLNEREQAEVQQLLFDMGYPLRQDRGFMPDDDMEVWDTDNMDWAANYRG